jgi:thymidine kinase
MSKVEHLLKKLTSVYKKTNNEKSIKYFKPKLQNFVKHNFVSRWQNKQFKASIISFPENIIVFILLKTIHLRCKLTCSLCIGI